MSNPSPFADPFAPRNTVALYTLPSTLNFPYSKRTSHHNKLISLAPKPNHTHQPTVPPEAPPPCPPLNTHKNLRLEPVSYPKAPGRQIRPHKPKAGCEIEPNPLRPYVAAQDRLFSWDTPFGIKQKAGLRDAVPEQLIEPMLMTIRSALAPSSKSTYAAGPLRWTQFCDKLKISEEDRMPARFELVVAFISECRGKHPFSTISNWLTGIRSWHLVNLAPWCGDGSGHPWIDFARTTARKEGAVLKRPIRAPVSLEHLFCLKRALDITTPLHAAIWAVALCTFWGCRRLGETTVSNGAAFDARYNVTRASRIFFNATLDGTESAYFRIPWTKSTREDGALVILTGRRDELCPIRALKNHMAVNEKLPCTASLFAYHTKSGFKQMLKQTFLSVTSDIWKAADLEHVHGHSLRIGGAVELLLAGVPPEIVAQTGGWTSLAFLLYWRKIEEILPRCTSKAYNSNHLRDLAILFEKFREKSKISPATLEALTN